MGRKKIKGGEKKGNKGNKEKKSGEVCSMDMGQSVF